MIVRSGGIGDHYRIVRVASTILDAHAFRSSRIIPGIAPQTAPSNRTAALLDHLARLSRARADSALEQHGLRPRGLVALTLLRDHGAFSQGDLAAALQLDKTNVVVVLNDLEAGGLATRRRAAEDRRRHVVEITPAGLAKLAEAERALGTVEDHVLGGLTGEDRDTLYRLLKRATDGHLLDCATAKQDWASSGNGDR